MSENVLNDNSILIDVKKVLGVNPLYEEDFDSDLIMAINTSLMALNQLGFGVEGFYITGETETWSDLLQSDEVDLHAVKTWVALRTRMIFDPPTSSALIEALKQSIAECEWRIYINKNFVGEIDSLYKNA